MIVGQQHSAFTRTPDGQCVHLSEIFCHQTGWHIKRGEEPLAALTRTLGELPAEVALLAINGPFNRAVQTAVQA